MKEEWREVLPNIEVSSLGRVRSKTHISVFYNKKIKKEIRRRSPAHLRRLVTGGSGYKQIEVHKKKYSVHRLVALAFIPNPKNKKVVNHLDGDKANNIVSNLEWVTPSENDLHAFRIGLRSNKKEKHPQFGKYIINKTIKKAMKFSGELNHHAKLNEREVREIRNLAGKITQADIASKYNITARMVSAIIRRTSWAHIE
jgi:hypothetical protein